MSYDEPGPWIETAPFSYAQQAARAHMPDEETCAKIAAAAARYPYLRRRPARLAQLAEVDVTEAQMHKVLGTYDRGH